MKNTNKTLMLNLTQPDLPLPESWRRVALDIVHTKVWPAFQKLAEHQSVIVAGNRAKSPEIEVKRLPAQEAPWRVRVQLNSETVLFVARHTLRLVHGDTTYQASY